MRYIYNSNGQLSSVKNTVNGQSWTTQYSYDNDGRPTITTIDTGYSVNFAYNATGTLASRIIRKANGSAILSDTATYVDGISINDSNYTGTAKTDLIHTYTTGGTTSTYAYDDNSNIIGITTGASTISYVYDNLNQLVRENNPTTGYTTLYSYDNAGNMTRKRIYNYTVDPSPVGPIDTIDYTYRSSGWKDQLVSYDGNTITYDDSGNPLTYGDYGFNWSGRQLDGIINVSSPVSFIASYKYNDQGLRTKKTLTGNVITSYTWDGTELVGQTDGTTTLLFSYDQSGSAVSVKYNGATYYYQRNGQGDIIGLYNASGTRVVAYTYDTWGKLLSTTGSLASTLGVKNPLRYRGYYYDTESGFYYLQSRYYDPDTCRFLNADDTAFTGATGTIVGHNLYAYCENNPVNGFDPNGCFYIRLSDLRKILTAIAINPIPAVLVAIGLLKLKALIVAKLAVLGAKLGAFWGPVAALVLSAVFAGAGLKIGGDFAEALYDCVMQGKKGIEVTVKYSKWGWPYSLDIYAK